MVEYLERSYYRPRKLQMRACHPRDLVEQVVDICRYQKQEPAITRELLDMACSSYFLEETESQGAEAMRALATALTPPLNGRSRRLGRRRPRPFARPRGARRDHRALLDDGLPASAHDFLETGRVTGLLLLRQRNARGRADARAPVGRGGRSQRRERAS